MRQHYLVTTYNHRPFLEQMLASIRAQYPTLEDFRQQASVLVIDDVSRDGTQQLLLDLAAKHPNVQVHLNESNQGIGPNRNFLLDWLCAGALAADDMVLFVDGDDLLTTTHLRDKLSLFAAEPRLQCVGGQLELFYEDGSPSCVVDTFSTDPDVQAIANLFECHFYISNAMFRASVFQDPKVRFPETPTSEDWLFFALHPMVKRHCREVTLRYRRHAHNLTTHDFGDEVFRLRRSVRTLGLLRIGMHPSDRDCQLLDLVGYLSFRSRWQGARPVPVDCHMPWFNYVGRRTDVVSQWVGLRQEVHALFARMKVHNERVTPHPSVKFGNYLDQLLRSADTEIAKAATAMTAVGA